jgi:hypothetical protein
MDEDFDSGLERVLDGLQARLDETYIKSEDGAGGSSVGTRYAASACPS